ncbi:MAG: translocation/assembly module TamB [Sphingobacteriaceae bacterium]|nr:MAG: translocation/assembly module TamB [Sphingobacteriaceae bacterium]
MVSILLIVFQYKPVQTWAAKKAAKYFSKELNTTVSIKSLYIKPFSSVVLEGFFVLDQQKDTLINTPKLSVDINGFSVFSSIKNKTINIDLIQLDNGSFYLKKLKNRQTNLQFILDHFASKDTVKKAGKPWIVNLKTIGVNNLRFRYKNQLNEKPAKGIDFDDFDVYNFSVKVNNVDIKNHLFKGDIHQLTLREKSGFYLKNLTAITTIDTNQIVAQNMLIQTPHTILKDYFKMSFRNMDDFAQLESKVRMEANFKDSRLSSTDIAYFSGDALDKVNFDLGIDGQVRGLINNIRTKNLTIKAGKSTYIKGDFNIRGLPDWENTFLELQFDQVATNKKDIDNLMAGFTGDPKAKAPDVVSKFGNINFTGRFTGVQNDFVAYGVFKTKLGRFDPDINLKINKAGHPSYSGKINTYDFDLGTLIDNKDLGRITVNANVNGSGDDLKSLDTRVTASIKNIDFKNYNYSNVTLNGTFANQKAVAKLKINDKNIKLNLDGSIDLKPELPLYDFTANIDNAELNTIKLLKDTITFSAQMRANGSGSTLQNFEGELLLSPIKLISPTKNYVVDSLYLSAKGKGDNRSISLVSDVMDGSIKGSYDLATLPDYFKTIVKKYIPSLKTDIGPHKPQHFDFNLKLKNLDPLLAAFMPELQVPDKGTFIGKFNSNNKTATLNGYIKTIKYDGIIFNDLIIDENTTDDYLGLNVSLSRVDLSKDLYVKNINITNFLKQDSLNFNIKLADKDATNQLDLYGLVQFGRDTTARLSLLPSDVILENQSWKIQDKVDIRLLDGKTKVSGFELSNGEQMVKIDGFISANPEDELKVTFDKFRMATINQLTKISGVTLGGLLNGDVLLTGVTKSPGVDANLTIDSLKMNETLVGNVKLGSTLDNAREKVKVKINILNRGLETLNISGAYLLGKGEDEKLDFDVSMNQTEAVIISPFTNGLISNIKGTISNNLKVTGTLKKLLLNGDLTFNNTGLTVDYLKTAYTINDRLSVNNSVVNIENMSLKDTQGGEGKITGTVDLNNLSNPILDVTLTIPQGQKLMALNTNFKDNHTYFGTAYAAANSRFSFTGPIDNMNIDIRATTAAGTVFNIPLNTSSTVSDYDFITYVSHRDTAKVAAKENAFGGVTLNFDLTADEATVVKITTDYGKLEGTGTTNGLKLKINSLGDFEMVGDYNIVSGKFEFTSNNLISKNFTVSQGGNIRWTGNPANAEINLKALYEVRTDISNLYLAAGSQSPQGKKQVLVQAEMILTKSLIKPDIDFNFNFPTEPNIKDDLATYLSDINNRNQQALSIIVRRNFAPGTGNSITNEAFQTAQTAVSEFAFNKLNSLISQSNIKNVDLNIRSYNDASASVRLFNERLRINGSLFTNSGSGDFFNLNNNLFNSGFNNLTKDFEASYLIRPDGDLRARFSYRALNNTTLNTYIGSDGFTAQYVNGIGLVYQRDFDTVGEFFRNMFTFGNRRRRQRALADTTGKNIVLPDSIRRRSTINSLEDLN